MTAGTLNTHLRLWWCVTASLFQTSLARACALCVALSLTHHLCISVVCAASVCLPACLCVYTLCCCVCVCVCQYVCACAGWCPLWSRGRVQAHLQEAQGRHLCPGGLQRDTTHQHNTPGRTRTQDQGVGGGDPRGGGSDREVLLVEGEQQGSGQQQTQS